MMSENNKIGTYKFVAEPFHVDFTGRLTMGVLGNHLLNCAGFHASDRGFGIATLNEDNYTWVLSRLAVELDEMPYQYEDFSIQTWVENVYRLFTDRNFAIIDKEGKKIGYARSVWAMISMNTRKPADLLALHSGSIVDYVCDEPCPIEKPSRIKVASKELSLALTNIIENAVKYNVDNGWVKVTLNADHRNFYVKVADSGVGIPDDCKEHVFERFYRVDKARSRDTGGTGLGLAITKSVIQMHKGSIKLYSESGEGTTFTIRIPMKSDASVDTARKEGDAE